MEFTIRSMQVGDIPQVQHVAKTSWHSTYEGIIPLTIQERFLDVAYSDEMMKKRVENSFIFVVEVAERVVGFADFSPVKKVEESNSRRFTFIRSFKEKVWVQLIENRNRPLHRLERAFYKR